MALFLSSNAVLVLPLEGCASPA